MRVFLALDFDAAAVQTLQTYQHRLQRESWADQVRWSGAANLHLTLRFLGEISRRQAEQYARDFRDATATLLRTTSELTLAVTPPCLFPDPAHPRVVACLVRSNTILMQIVASAESCAVGIGLAPERRRFNGHITLGRVREGAALRAPGRFLIEAAESAMRAEAITLYESTLTPRGAVYTPLARFSLRSQV